MRSMPSPQRFVALVGYVLGGIAFCWGLPEQVPPSWTVSAGRTFWLGAPMMAFLLPTAMIVTDVLLRGLCVEHPIGDPDSPNSLAVYDAIMLRFTVFVIGVHGV